MKIFKDIITSVEVFSDAYPVKFEEDDFLVCCKGKVCKRSKNATIDDSLIGGNASQEESQEQCDDSEEVESGIDFMLGNECLRDWSDVITTKKALQKHLKNWAKQVVEKLEADGKKEQAEEFKLKCKCSITKFIDKYVENETSVYVALKESDDDKVLSALYLGQWDEDGMGMQLWGIAPAMEQEKL